MKNTHMDVRPQTLNEDLFETLSICRCIELTSTSKYLVLVE